MSARSRVGTTIGEYKLERVLGWGGMSVVYLAEHRHLGRKVALKLVSVPLGEEEGFRERFEHECKRAAEIDHPNIIAVYDAGERDDERYIAMRYVRGRDLRQVIAEQRPLGVERTLQLVEQVAGALDAAHARGVIHRDVKPANILVEEPGDHVYLTDFGIAKQSESHGLTRTGMFVGTVNYAAPEQIEGLSVDGRADIYALGCVLFECLTGTAPFARDSEIAVLHAHLKEPPPAVSSARPDLPRALDRVVGRAMAKRPGDRYASCGELVRAAGEALLGEPDESTRALRGDEAISPTADQATVPAALRALQADTPRPVGRKPRWRDPWMLAAAAGAALAAAVAVALVLVMTGGGDGAEQAAQQTAGAASNSTQLVGTALAEDCAPAASLPAGATEAVSCTSEFEGVAVALEAAAFPDEGSLDDAYAAATSVLDPVEGGTCEETFSTEEQWSDGASGARGVVRCAFEGDDALILWTREPGANGSTWILSSLRVADYDTTTALESWTSLREQVGAATE